MTEKNEVTYKGYKIKSAPYKLRKRGWSSYASIEYRNGNNYVVKPVVSGVKKCFDIEDEAIKYGVRLARKWIDDNCQ